MSWWKKIRGRSNVGGSKFVGLPNEVLFKVVSMLDLDSILSFRITCCKFYGIASDPSFWSDKTCISMGKIYNEKNLKAVLKLSMKYLEHLSVTSYSKPLCLSEILCPIQDCKCLRSISLANLRTVTDSQITAVLQLPALIELHIDCVEYAGINIFDAVAATRSDLKVLSIPQKWFLFNEWADAGYAPPHVRVFFGYDYDRSFHRVHINRIRWSYQSLSPVQHKACLSIYKHTSEFASLHSDLIVQVHFNPPNMKPFVLRNKKIILSEDTMGSNIFSSVTSFNTRSSVYSQLDQLVSLDCLCSDEQSKSITSLNLYDFLISDHRRLLNIAATYPNLLHLYFEPCFCGHATAMNLDVLASFSKLQSLDVGCSLGYSWSANPYLEHLWAGIGALCNLTCLTLPYNIMPVAPNHVILPALKAIRLYKLFYGCGPEATISDHSCYLTMPSLRYFRSPVSVFEILPVSEYLSGCTRKVSGLCYYYPQLTHLFLELSRCAPTDLPPDARLYRNLECMYLSCGDYDFSEELATAISECKHLKVLVLDVFSISVRSIKMLFKSLTSLSLFYVRTHSAMPFPSEMAAKALSKSLVKAAKSRGQNIDLLLTVRESALLSETQLRVYFSL